MKISIRPAPHSKSCAADGRKSCDLYQNHQEKCQEKCTDSMCCEMKHCWQIGEALEKELTALRQENAILKLKCREKNGE